MIQRTLVLLKPDAVQRGLTGRILERFENAGLKIVAMKMIWADEKLAAKHYNDLGERRGEEVKKRMVDFLTKTGPVVALVLEGVEAVEVVRKLVGGTEPKTALPGTIRGDFAHLSLVYGDSKNKAVPNLIHASGSVEEAKKEIALWFKPQEIHSYKLSYEEHVL
ncbi:MAG: nucleoside-diphosphate kinase [Candidatus Pacearchaeota archaeon]|nr:nucleoside-diphosphate kinase [Candidatus Pacearchaeota archaeon]